MNFEIIKNHSKLFLFQIIEHGMKQNLIDEHFLIAMIKQAVEMSFVFARKYYTIVYDAHLNQASDCVLGIMNLGLIESSDNNRDKALKLLIQKGYFGAFRKGWQQVAKLAVHARTAEYENKTAFEWEKDFSEIFSAKPGKYWNGHNEYLAHMLFYSRKGKSKNEFH